MAAATLTAQIDVDERGVARIAGTRIKVSMVALEYGQMGMSAEEIQAAHDHLNLAQIHAALAYYYEHKAEIDERLEDDLRKADTLARELSDPNLREKLLRAKAAQSGAQG